MNFHYMSISDFAHYKKTSRQTIYNNLDKLTTQKIKGKLRITLDPKSEEWIPKEQYIPKSILENK